MYTLNNQSIKKIIVRRVDNEKNSWLQLNLNPFAYNCNFVTSDTQINATERNLLEQSVSLCKILFLPMCPCSTDDATGCHRMTVTKTVQ